MAQETNLTVDQFGRGRAVRRSAGARHAGTVLSVNVGTVRTVIWQGRPVTTGIWKSPRSGRIAVRGVNLAGDDQADRAVHGGPDKAVYAYAQEDLMWWAAELGKPIEPGTFGENLTTSGIEVTNAVVGERWAIGSAVFEVSQPRMPCYKLGMRMGDPGFPSRFAGAARPGAYLRIVDAGVIGAGDEIKVLSRPAHGVTVGRVARAYHTDRSLVAWLLTAPQLPDAWVEWARHQLRVRGEPDHDAARA